MVEPEGRALPRLPEKSFADTMACLIPAIRKSETGMPVSADAIGLNRTVGSRLLKPDNRAGMLKHAASPF
jgi:hypothetical protein